MTQTHRNAQLYAMHNFLLQRVLTVPDGPEDRFLRARLAMMQSLMGKPAMETIIRELVAKHPNNPELIAFLRRLS